MRLYLQLKYITTLPLTSDLGYHQQQRLQSTDLYQVPLCFYLQHTIVINLTSSPKMFPLSTSSFQLLSCKTYHNNTSLHRTYRTHIGQGLLSLCSMAQCSYCCPELKLKSLSIRAAHVKTTSDWETTYIIILLLAVAKSGWLGKNVRAAPWSHTFWPSIAQLWSCSDGGDICAFNCP